MFDHSLEISDFHQTLFDDQSSSLSDYSFKQLHGFLFSSFVNQKFLIFFQTLPNGTSLKLPPILLGKLGNDPTKKTVVIYGHLDVQPAAKEDGWDTEPFVLTEKDGKLYGRGSTDDKGPVLGWINAIQAYQALKIPIPINLKVQQILFPPQKLWEIT